MQPQAELNLAVAILTGAVAATLVPAVRRTVPRWIELILWVAFALACVMAVAQVRDPHARELRDSISWGIGQMFHMGARFAATATLDWAVAHWLLLAALVAAGATALLAPAWGVAGRSLLTRRTRMRDWHRVRLPVEEVVPLPVRIGQWSESVAERVRPAALVAQQRIRTVSAAIVAQAEAAWPPALAAASRARARAAAAARVGADRSVQALGLVASTSTETVIPWLGSEAAQTTAAVAPLVEATLEFAMRSRAASIRNPSGAPIPLLGPALLLEHGDEFSERLAS